MNRNPWLRVLCCLALFAPPALAVQRPKPTPPPAPAPAPAPTPADTGAQREAQAKQQRIEKARQAEAERLKQEQDAERVRRARAEASEAERIQRAREQAANQPPPATPPAAARAELRETAREMFRIEDVHRDRLGRLDRLLAIYGESGDAAKLAEVQRLKAQENKRYTLIMNQFKEQLGPAYGQFESQLLVGQVRPRRLEKPDATGSPPAPARRREAKPPVKDEQTGGGQ